MNKKFIKKKSVKRNYVYNLIYQIFLIIVPLVLTPYVSRVLGASGIGKYSFAYSIASYFILFGSFGFGYYAQREIARNQGDKHSQTIIFWEIIIARMLSVFISIIVYLTIYFMKLYGDYSSLMLILLINVAATAFDISYIFQGNEEFGVLAMRNIFIKIIGITLIMIFVKSKDDLPLYTFLNSIILVGSNLSLWPNLNKMLVHVDFNEIHFKRHLKPALRLFLPTIATSIYTMLDKTLIGIIVPDSIAIVSNDGTTIFENAANLENGYYESAEKIVKMSMMIVTSLGTVMIPRNSQEIASGKINKFIDNIYKALKFVFFLGIPIMFGILAVSINFCPWFFGAGYEKVPYLMMIFSPLVVIIGISNVLGVQCLIPQRKDKQFAIAIIAGAIINLVLNLFLIKFFWSYGAAISSVVAELIITIIMVILLRKQISFFNVVKENWKYILSGIIMFSIVFLTQLFLESSVLNTLLLIVEGIIVYFLFLILLKDRFIFELYRNIMIKMRTKKSIRK